MSLNEVSLKKDVSSFFLSLAKISNLANIMLTGDDSLFNSLKAELTNPVPTGVVSNDSGIAVKCNPVSLFEY